jgi:hypothetical protein
VLADESTLVSESSVDAFQSEIEPATDVFHCDVIDVLTLIGNSDPSPAQW